MMQLLVVIAVAELILVLNSVPSQVQLLVLANCAGRDIYPANYRIDSQCSFSKLYYLSTNVVLINAVKATLIANKKTRRYYPLFPWVEHF